MDLIIAVLGIVLIVGVCLWFRRRDPRLPPSPTTPLPIVGHLFTLKSDPRPQFKKWHEEVGDVFSLQLGGTFAVVFNGYALLKETFVKRGDEFADRPVMSFDEISGIPGKGVIGSSGPAWKEQRAVTISILRSFGMGKNILAQKIQEEIGWYLKALEYLKGEPTDLRMITNQSIANTVCALIIGRRFDYGDEIFKDLQDQLHTVALLVGQCDTVNYLPFLSYLPGDLFKVKKCNSCFRQIFELFVNKFIALARQQKDKDESGNNFIAAYDAEWKKKIDAGQPTTMDDEHLVKIIWDTFAAGTETTASTLLFCILHMLNYPDEQVKIFEEIDREIGTERTPTPQDKNKLVYLNAYISETSRYANISPFAAPHTCPQDVIVRGYTIPKGTYIIPNLESVMRDPKIWGQDVNEFRPGRFVDEQGKLKNFEELVAFGLGRRICPGEGMAKISLFLYLSSMIQRFRFECLDPSSPPSMEQIFSADILPKPYEVRVIDRKKDV